MMTTKGWMTAICATLMTAATSCGDGHESADYRRISPDGWVYGDTVKLDVGLAPALAPSTDTLSVALRHTNDYPYRNLWLEVTYDDASGRRHTDTLALELCDAYGRWYGKGIGDYYQVASPVAAGMTLPDTTIVGVRHIMRVDTLRGIESVGVMTVRGGRHN